MHYSIKEVAAKMNIPASTIRYYDKEGLLPNLERRDSGYRLFTDGDLSLLQIIECFKRTGMSLKEIKQFCDWIREGDASLENRYQLFLERKKVVEQQMQDMQKTLDLVNHKCEYYQQALEAGTEDVHKQPIAVGR